ncbi:MAG: hypothetical protein U1F09_05860 [Steroidobacteraceae bacterium]
MAVVESVHVRVKCVPSDQSSAVASPNPTPNPDAVLYHGLWFQLSDETTANVEEFDTSALDVGDCVLEVYDYRDIDPTATVRRDRTCMTVTITG